ncbi:MAG: hypothetical protein FWE52_01115 [Alphaproteobacteria bacterium]|nr:hypothetical protein [Alphaproteobacteria bacterium]
MIKKHNKKSAVRPAARPAPAMSCACDSGCKCKSWFWKIVLWIVIFAIGFCAGKMCCMKHMMWKKQFTFDANGCLDVSKLRGKMAAKIAAADLNNDGCITKVELKEWKISKFEQKIERLEQKIENVINPDEDEECPEDDEEKI